MWVSGVIAIASLTGVLLLGFAAGALLVIIDKRCANGREH